MKWEYKPLECSAHELMDKLKELGEESWEVCGGGERVVSGNNYGEWRLLLKRPIQEPDAQEQHIDAVAKAREEYRRGKIVGQ